MSPESKSTLDSKQAQPAGQAGDRPASMLAQECDRWNELLLAQPVLIQHFIRIGASTLAGALIQPARQASFSLPDRIIVAVGDNRETPVPAEFREQQVGGPMNRLARTGLNAALRQRLDELEASSLEAVSTSAGLLRYATATALVHDLLPAGRTVRYQRVDGEEIPTIPVAGVQELDSAITAQTDAITEESTNVQEQGRGELLVPYVPAARRFFLPQWVAFDEEDRLLVHSTSEAEAQLASMQRFVRILHTAVALAAYMVADEDYQQKRYGMLGQLVNQGRALARFETREIIVAIQHRAAANNLNRGLSIRLPYFDDQILQIKFRQFDAIPAGRIMFLPGLVALAAQKEQVKVEQDTRLSRSTRRHLLEEFQMLVSAFDPANQKKAKN